MARIHWRSTLTGATGHGEPMDRAVAQSWLERLCAECPGIEHWLEDA